MSKKTTIKIPRVRVGEGEGQGQDEVEGEFEDEGESEGDGFWVIFSKFSKIVKQKNKILGFGGSPPP